jgi:hypothetical protein
MNEEVSVAKQRPPYKKGNIGYNAVVHRNT